MTNDAWRRARSDAPYQRKANVIGAIAVGRAPRDRGTPSRFIRHSSFFIRASPRISQRKTRGVDFIFTRLRHLSSGSVHSSSAQRMADFPPAIFFPIKTSSVLSLSNGSRSQRPTTKLNSCAPSAKRTKPFARITAAGRLSANRSKQSREKVFLELNVNHSNSK